MAEYTSGTSAFNLSLNEIFEEAFERCDRELRTGYDFRTARRSLNLLTVEWANKGINLWTIEQGQIPLVTGQICYPIPVDTIDLLDTVIRQNNGTQNQIDINISRISESTYSTIPNKLTQGRPIQVWINRQSGNTNATTAVLSTSISSSDTSITVSDASQLAAAGYIQLENEIIYYANVNGNQLINCARGQNNTTAVAHSATPTLIVYVPWLPSVNVWPTPNAPGNQYTFIYWRLRRIQDAGEGVNVQDIPFRFVNAMVAGLAFYLAAKLGCDIQRYQALQAEYMQQFDLAAQEDREKAPLRIVPRNMNYYR